MRSFIDIKTAPDAEPRQRERDAKGRQHAATLVAESGIGDKRGKGSSRFGYFTEKQKLSINQAKVLRSSRRRILPDGVLGTASTK